MKEHDSSFSPEAIDALTGHEPGKQLLPDEQRLIRDVYSLSQEYARENERSLERIWNRLEQQGQEQPAHFQQQETGTPGLFREGKAMPQKDIYQELLQERRQQGNDQAGEFSTLDSQPTKRAGRSRWRALGMSAAAAVVVLTILSWAILSAGLRHGPKNTPVAHQQAADFHTGTLLCSFTDNDKGSGIPASIPFQPTLDWSANGQIASTYDSLGTFSAQNCARHGSIPGIYSTALWSPDGKRLLVFNQATNDAQVLDASTGHVIASYPPVQSNTGSGTASVPAQATGLSFMDSLSGGGPGGGNASSPSVVASAWSSDGTQVISAMAGLNGQVNSATSVVIWNASTGKLVRTATIFPAGLQYLGMSTLMDQHLISPGGKYVALENAENNIEIWSIVTGKLVSTIPFSPAVTDPSQSSPSAVAWSPDSSSLALGLPNASDVQIWSVTNGTLITTFRDRDAVNPVDKTKLAAIGDLAWSPDGTYLAEAASDIHIWDVSANKLVATFGKVATNGWIGTLAWSTDGKRLASTETDYTTNSKRSPDYSLNTVNVWQLP